LASDQLSHSASLGYVKRGGHSGSFTAIASALSLPHPAPPAVLEFVLLMPVYTKIALAHGYAGFCLVLLVLFMA